MGKKRWFNLIGAIVLVSLVVSSTIQVNALTKGIIENKDLSKGIIQSKNEPNQFYLIQKKEFEGYSEWYYHTDDDTDGRTGKKEIINFHDVLLHAYLRGMNFTENRMMHSWEGIYTTYKEGYKNQSASNADLTHKVTSESTGLMMMATVLFGDKTRFDEQLNIVVNNHRDIGDSKYVLVWKLNENSEKWKDLDGYYSNDLKDDFRVIRSLIYAYEKWKDPVYLYHARKLGVGIRTNNAHFQDHTLRSKYYWKGPHEKLSDEVELSSLYLDVMLYLKQYDINWHEEYRISKELLENSQTECGLFYPEFNAKTGLYTRDFVTIREATMIAENLKWVKMNKEVQKYLDFVKNEYETKGKVYDWYYVRTCKPVIDKEDIANYALIARLATMQGDKEFAKEILYKKILPYQEFDYKTEYYGTFDKEEDNARAYRNLEVLETIARVYTWRKGQGQMIQELAAN